MLAAAGCCWMLLFSGRVSVCVYLSVCLFLVLSCVAAVYGYCTHRLIAFFVYSSRAGGERREAE